MNGLRRRDERGVFTIWTLGLCVCLIFIGGLSLDLWRAFGERRELAGMVDGAAVAAASQIDLVAFRSEPSVVQLDRGAAIERARTYLLAGSGDAGVELENVLIDVNSEGSVVVEAETTIGTTLLRILRPTEKTLTVRVVSTADPQVVP